MKKLKNLSLFKITLLLLINIIVLNKYIFILTIIYLFIESKCDLLIFILLIIIITLTNSINVDYIRYGVVESKQEKYVIVDKLLYKTKVYDTSLEYGDIVKFHDNSNINSSNYDLKHNIKFTYNSNLSIIGNIKVRRTVNKIINNFDSKTSSYLKRIILNDYSINEDIEDIGYGFSFYYLIQLIKRKNKKASYIISLIYLLILGFEVKLHLIFIDMLLDSIDVTRINKLCTKTIIIILINKSLLYNYSIIISILLSLYYMSDLKKDKFYIAIIQSILFNEIQLFTLFFYKYLIYFRILMFLASLIVLLIPGLSNIYIFLIELIANLLKYLNFGIRGKINYIVLIIQFIIFKKFKINNQYIKILILLMVLISPINNPLKHLTFIDVGQGDSALIKGPLNSYNVLIDTGSSYNYSKLKKELFKQGVYKIDYLILTHNDSDHSGNADRITKDFSVKEIIEEGKDINIGNDFLDYMYLGNYDNDNDNSLVYLLDFNNYKILFTGDISKKVENRIFDNLDTVDILKVSHHGSSTASSNYFIGKLNPRFAIISTSGAYNHPSSEVINTLDSYYVHTFITKNDGSISFYFTGIIDFIKTSFSGFVII